MPMREQFRDIENGVVVPRCNDVGICLSCKHWQVNEPRFRPLIHRLARCIQLGLVVSGVGTCSEWQQKMQIDAEVSTYAEKLQHM